MKVLILLSIALLSLSNQTKLSKRDIIGEAYSGQNDPGTKAVSYNVIQNNENKLPPVSTI